MIRMIIFGQKRAKYNLNDRNIQMITCILQSWAKDLLTLSRFNTISLFHKWNGARLLLPGSECTSCLTSCQTT